jgi:hypothetical protein
MMPRKKYFTYVLLFLVVLVSRLPFLSAGYGVEEDSWGIVLAAGHTWLSGIYEPSRFPGHPVHEWIYSACWGHAPSFYNFFSAFFSAVAAVAFALILKHLDFKYSILAAFALAFTPVVYISSTYTIDFTWSLAFMLISFYLLLKERFIVCGIFLGLAIGCRITMGAMLLPFLLILWNQHDRIKNFAKIIFPMALVVLLVFLPLIRQFGTSFFMYYDQFPYPPMPKVLYKMSIGVFGLIGVVMLLICTCVYLFKKSKSPGTLFTQPLQKNIVAASFLVIVLFVISYFRLPQKSGYMITVIPFLLLLAGYFLDKKWFFALCISLLIAPFICSINLTDQLRGAKYSDYAVKFNVSGQEIFFDPFSGPLFSDYSKRRQKMHYVADVISTAQKSPEKTALISGWWYNEIMISLFPDEQEGKTKFVPYIDSLTIVNYREKGYSVKFLPEQDLYNDQMFGMHYTRQAADEFITAEAK